MLEALVDATTGPVADLGHGPGQIGRFVRSHGRTVVGVDISWSSCAFRGNPVLPRRVEGRSSDGRPAGDDVPKEGAVRIGTSDRSSLPGSRATRAGRPGISLMS